MATNGDLARRLLGAAQEDELAARSVLRVEGIADPIVGFHTHQAVEKAIKAVLAAKGTEFPFTHNERVGDAA
jgi:HEPN domain-containing protein